MFKVIVRLVRGAAVVPLTVGGLLAALPFVQARQLYLALGVTGAFVALCGGVVFVAAGHVLTGLNQKSKKLPKQIQPRFRPSHALRH